MLKFFDANCMVGRRAKKYSFEPVLLENAADYAAKYGISKLLVFHAYAKECHPGKGNELTFDICKTDSRLVPQIVLLPDIIWEETDLRSWLESMVDMGARAVRLFPKEHGYLMNKRTLAPLLDEVSTLNIPLFVDLESTDWHELTDLLEVYDGPVILSRTRAWGDDRYYYPLLRDFKNFFVETSQYKFVGGIEAIYDRFGHGRLVFGSGLPQFAAGNPVTQLQYSDIPTEAKEAIAFRNMQTLIDGVKGVR